MVKEETSWAVNLVSPKNVKAKNLANPTIGILAALQRVWVYTLGLASAFTGGQLLGLSLGKGACRTGNLTLKYLPLAFWTGFLCLEKKSFSLTSMLARSGSAIAWKPCHLSLLGCVSEFGSLWLGSFVKVVMDQTTHCLGLKEGEI